MWFFLNVIVSPDKKWLAVCKVSNRGVEYKTDMIIKEKTVWYLLQHSKYVGNFDRE